MHEPAVRAPGGGRAPSSSANDLFALLRAGTDAPDAAVVICGTGINGAALRGDGAIARVLALGHCSGDWGGGARACRGGPLDGRAGRGRARRGHRTARSRPAMVRVPRQSTSHVAVHRRARSVEGVVGPRRTPRSSRSRTGATRSPATCSTGRARRSASWPPRCWRGSTSRRPPYPVVLGGGIGATGDPTLTAAMATTLAAGAPLARLEVTTRSPIDGAVALALASVP